MQPATSAGVGGDSPVVGGAPPHSRGGRRGRGAGVSAAGAPAARCRRRGGAVSAGGASPVTIAQTCASQHTKEGASAHCIKLWVTPLQTQAPRSCGIYCAQWSMPMQHAVQHSASPWRSGDGLGCHCAGRLETQVAQAGRADRGLQAGDVSSVREALHGGATAEATAQSRSAGRSAQ
jgi:hypothetical protein